MSIEAWKSFFDGATVLLLFLTFVAGAGVLLTGNVINRRQAAQLHQFESDITAAKTELAKQQERAAKAEAGIASAQAEAAKANQIAEGERLARVKIEERLAWRRISPKTHDELVQILKPYAHSSISVVGFDNADIESKTFAEDVAKMLKDAGWSVRFDLSNTRSNLPIGIICRLNASPAGGALARALKTQISNVIIETTNFDDSIGYITVGLRPPP